jgi:hypothetical protein
MTRLDFTKLPGRTIGMIGSALRIEELSNGTVTIEQINLVGAFGQSINQIEV